jgi:hypothetical protein
MSVDPSFSHPIDLNIESHECKSANNQPESGESLVKEFKAKVNNKHVVIKMGFKGVVQQVAIEVPLVIENRTFRKLVISDADGCGFEATVQRNQVDYPMYCYLNDRVNLVIKVVNLQSETVTLSKKQLLQQPFDTKFWLFNDDDLQTMKLYLHVPVGDKIRLVFYHQTILLNETFVNWWFSQSLRYREIRNTELMPHVDSCPQILFVKHKTPLLFACEHHQGPKMQLDVSKPGPTFYEMDTLDGHKYEFSITLENRKVSDHAAITQNVVHFVPKFVFINQTKSAAKVADSGMTREVVLNPNCRQAISFGGRSKSDHLLCLKFPTSEWSSPVPYSRTAFFLFSVKVIGADELFLVNLEVNFSNNSYYIILLESELGCCSVANRTDDLRMWLFQDLNQATADKWDLEVLPNASKVYAWKHPNGQTDVLHVLVADSGRTVLGRFAVKMNKAETRQVLKLGSSDFVVETFEKGFCLQVQLMPLDKLFVDKPMKAHRANSVVSLAVEEVGLSFVFGEGEHRKELVYGHLSHLMVRSDALEKHTEIDLSLDYLSVDFNAKASAVFPVLLVPRYQKGIMRSQGQKTLKAKVVKKNDSVGLNVFENVEVALFPCVVKLEEDCLVSAIQAFNQVSKMAEERSQFFSRKFPEPAEEEVLLKALKRNWKLVFIEETQSVFVQRVCLSEFQLIVSFRKSLETRASNHSLSTYLNLQNAIGAFLVTIDDFPLLLPDVQLSRESKSVGVLRQLLLQRYKTVAFNSVLKLIASANIIGNPLNLYNEIRTGFTELMQTERVRSKRQGWTNSTQSFVKHVVAGTSGTITKMTRTVGDGLSALTTDNEYLVERERLFSKSENKFLTGLKQLGFGLVDGLRGLVTKPVQGGASGGFKGALKGTYQGVSGLVLKPLAGVLDMASATADGVRQLCINKELLSSETRQRTPRAFYTAKRFFKTYDQNDADYHKSDIGSDGFQLILVEDVSCNLEKLVVCYEGLFIVDDKEIVWRKPIECIVGVICKGLLLTIEYFDVGVDTVVSQTRLVDYETQVAGNRIAEAINKAVESFNNKNRNCDEDEPDESLS